MIPGIRLEGERSRIDLSLASLRPGDELELEASVRGSIDASFIDALLDAPGFRVGGVAQLDVSASRTDGKLALNGTANVSNGRITSVDPALNLAGVNATLSARGSSLIIEGLSARIGSGSLAGGGTIELENLERPAVDLRITADGVPLEIMDGLRAEVSGRVQLASSASETKLSGNLAIDRGLLTRELDDDDASFSAQSIAIADPTAEPGLLDELELEIVIGTTRNVRIENSMAQLEATGSVSIGGTLASPELGGFVTLLPDGTFNVGRNRFQIVQGRVDLTGFPAVPPNVQLLAVTRVGSTVINADIDGDADDLRTRLSAPDSPDLTEGDLASLLVTGRTLENAGEGGQQIASTWMMSSMANLVHEGLGDLISFGPPAGAGPLILAEESDPTARLSLGFPVTERMSLTYSIALDNSERRMWIVDYRVARNFWIRGIQENANDYSIGISQRFDVDFRAASRAASRTRDSWVRGVSVSALDWSSRTASTSAPETATTTGACGTRCRSSRKVSSRKATRAPSWRSKPSPTKAGRVATSSSCSSSHPADRRHLRGEATIRAGGSRASRKIAGAAGFPKTSSWRI